MRYNNSKDQNEIREKTIMGRIKKNNAFEFIYFLLMFHIY